MKINPNQFRKRYNIPVSTEAKMRKDKVVPFQTIGRFIVYDQGITDDLAEKGLLGRNAAIAIANLKEADASEEHF